MLSGASPLSFWSATFLWDFINFLLPCFTLLIVFAIFKIEAYYVDGRVPMILLLFAVYGCAILPLMYLFSLLFTTASVAFVWMVMFNLFLGKRRRPAVVVESETQPNMPPPLERIAAAAPSRLASTSLSPVSACHVTTTDGLDKQR